MKSHYIIDELTGRLRLAIEDATRGKRPTALLLSGGLDSAIIQAIAKLDRIYCCTWEEEDNISAARLASAGKEVRAVTFTKDEMLEVIPEISKLTNKEGTWSQVCQWFLCRQAKKDGAEVILTGEGADELFLGYSRYRILYWLDRMLADPHLEAYQEVIRKVLGTCSQDEILTRLHSRHIDSGEARAQVEDHKRGQGITMVKQMGNIDFHTNLQTILKHETSMARAHNLEIKYPFMDPNVVHLTSQIPAGLLVTAGESKSILRRVARQLGIDSRITDEQTKKGLFIPQSWRPEGVPQWSRGWFTQLMRE